MFEKLENSYTLNEDLVFKYTLVTFLKFTVFEKFAKIYDEVRLNNYVKINTKLGQLQLGNRILANRKSVFVCPKTAL